MMGIINRYLIFALFWVTGYALRESSIDIHPNARWKFSGVIVAGGNGKGNGMNQLSMPSGLYVDGDQTVYVADRDNHRIMAWKSGATVGQVVAGGNGQGSNANQLNSPFDVIVDEANNSLIICDSLNKRVVRWPRENGQSGETIIPNVACRGLTMDSDGLLYVVDSENSAVKRYRVGESQGVVVAGGNGLGHDLNQLFEPQYIYVDQARSVYICEHGQSRISKWVEGAKERIVVAGGYGKGGSLKHLVYSAGIVVDQLGTVYIADVGNSRVVRWPSGASQGTIAVGRDELGQATSQLITPFGLAFDRHGNLYVSDIRSGWVIKYDLEFNG